MSEEGFLSEVLKSKEQTLIVDIKETIPVITSKIEKLRFDAESFIKNDEGRIRHHTNVPNNLLRQLNNLNMDMKEFDEKVNVVSKSGVQKTMLDIHNLEYELKKTRYSLKMADLFITFHEKYKELVQLTKGKDYAAVCSTLSSMRDIIREIPLSDNVKITETIAFETIMETNMFLKDLKAIWDQGVKVEVENDKSTKIIKLLIDNHNYDLKNIIPALYREQSTSRFECLADFLLEDVFSSIINNSVKIQITMVRSDCCEEVLDMRIKHNSPKMHYDSMFDHLSTVFGYLLGKIDYELDPNLTVVEYIGDRIRDKFSDMLIKNFIDEMIPSTEEEFDEYKKVVVRIEFLNNMLKTSGFFDEQSSKVLENAGNIELLYSNKICQNYWTTANSIFKKDLHDMVVVGVATSETDETKNMNAFAKCCVSQSACEVLTLIRKILEHAARSSHVYAEKLLHTTKQIIESYSVLVPSYHKRLLETIPQQSALFHNNCMYISHELLNNAEFYGQKMSKDGYLGESFDYQIKYLHTAGSEALMKVITTQVKTIEDILNESDLASLAHVEKLDEKCNKSIRQCLRQLEVLRTVWQKILNYDIYNKVIGDLLNSFTEHCVKLVLLAEDISATNSNVLVEMFQLIQARAPTLFTEPKEIHMFAKGWNKFKELVLLLNSSLSGIDERWADGKGPLAHEFAPDDVRKLIKALFQNTDHRAAVLARIYVPLTNAV